MLFQAVVILPFKGLHRLLATFSNTSREVICCPLLWLAAL
jgi:hypothetical protein